MTECILRNISQAADGAAWQSDRLLRIGRQEDFEIALKESSVSRRHAEVLFTGHSWVVRDLGSTNGTFLNGVRVGRAEQKLRDGDILQCGDVLLAVKLLSENRPAGQAPEETAVRVRDAVRQSWEEVVRLTAREAAAAPRAPEVSARLRALVQVGRGYRKVISQEDYLEEVLWQAAEALNAQSGCVLLRDPTTERLDTRATFDFGAGSGETAWAQSGAARQALGRGESLLCEITRAVPHPTPQSVLLALLRHQDRDIGLLSLARSGGQAPFTADDLCLADALALGAAAAVETIEQFLEAKRRVVLQTLLVLSQVLGMRDEYTGTHMQRLTDYAVLLAEALELSAWECQLLRVGAPLVDIGKVGVADAQLTKPGPLTPQEEADMRGHPLRGCALLESLPDAAPLLAMIRSHHENWDGSGYPDRLRGEAIPRLARVVAVADALDAMTSDRPYRPRRSLDETFAEIQHRSGTQFDPEVVAALLRIRPQIEEVHATRSQLTRTMNLAEVHRTRQGLNLGELRRKYLARVAVNKAAEPDSATGLPSTLLT